MTLTEAVKTIKVYCSKTECEDCVFGEPYKIDRYNGRIWSCELAGSPCEWKVPYETTIKKEAEQ